MKTYGISYKLSRYKIEPHYSESVTFYAEFQGNTDREAMKKLVALEKPNARVIKIERVKEVSHVY